MKQSDLAHKFLNYINLESEVDDFRKIHDVIERDLVFKGTNLWILVFAIIVASVGLNMNSTAVIIGAMLISPLMGPINGMGYSIATYNFPLFRKALKNFSFAVAASLLASTAYFAMSPISTAHSELLARTSPTIYDVLIAFFGGLAGIVATSSKQKGNVIPGVAIATALMPPLCTSGYGLATGQFEYFFGAIYLFTINTVFIAISSVVVSQILKFPITTLVDNAQKVRVNRWISVIISLVLIPSIYFGYKLVQQERFNENASRYIDNVSLVEGNFLLKYEIKPNLKRIKLVYGGSTLTEVQKETIRNKAANFSIEDAEIDFQQGLSFDALTTHSSEVDNLRFEVNRLNLMLQEANSILDSINEKKYVGKALLSEIKILHPEVIYCSYSDAYLFGDTLPEPEKNALVIFKLSGNKFSDSDRERVHRWLMARLNTEKVKVFYEH